jgi:hypothetical protein
MLGLCKFLIKSATASPINLQAKLRIACEELPVWLKVIYPWLPDQWLIHGAAHRHLPNHP